MYRHLFRTLCFAAATSLALGAGCSTRLSDRANFSGPTPALQEQLDTIIWPARDQSGLDHTLASTPDAIYLFQPTEQPLPNEAPARLKRAVQRPIASVRFSERLGVGILRELANRSDPARDPDNALRFVSVSTFPIKPQDERGSPWRWFLRSQAELGAPYAVTVNDEQVLSVLGQGLRMRVQTPPDGTPARGLIVHMPGLGSGDYERPVLDALRADGWAILRIATPRVWFYKPVEFNISRAADVQPVAKDIAGLIDDQLAEPAYAVEAALAYLQTERPDIPAHPCVMLGFSAGALFAPAIVARQPNAFDAAVLIGGGTNLFHISQTSDLTNGGLKVNWAIASDRDRFGEDLSKAYASHSQLDPLRTAPALSNMPTLLILAALDSTVPSSTGRKLQRLIPSAERWSLPVGHRLLFWLLPNKAESIVAWLDRATASVEVRSAEGLMVNASSATDSRTGSRTISPP